MVGVIILYDYVHPVGAFAKSSKIDVSTAMLLHYSTLQLLGNANSLFLVPQMKGCIKVLKDQPPNSVDGLLNALRWAHVGVKLCSSLYSPACNVIIATVWQETYFSIPQWWLALKTRRLLMLWVEWCLCLFAGSRRTLRFISVSDSLSHSPAGIRSAASPLRYTRLGCRSLYGKADSIWHLVLVTVSQSLAALDARSCWSWRVHFCGDLTSVSLSLCGGPKQPGTTRAHEVTRMQKLPNFLFAVTNLIWQRMTTHCIQVLFEFLYFLLMPV